MKLPNFQIGNVHLEVTGKTKTGIKPREQGFYLKMLVGCPVLFFGQGDDEFMVTRGNQKVEGQKFSLKCDDIGRLAQSVL